MPSLDLVAVILIVATVLFFAARWIYRMATGKASGCGRNCSACEPLHLHDPSQGEEPGEKSAE